MSTDSTPKTLVIGYQNKNGFPVRLRMAEFGINQVIAPEQFVMYGPRRLNDPEMEKYVAPAKLTRVEGKEMIPIVELVPLGAVESRPAHAVAGTQNVEMDAKGRIVRLPVVAEFVPREGRSAVKSYSIEEARAQGLLRKAPPSTRDPESLPGVTKGAHTPENPEIMAQQEMQAAKQKGAAMAAAEAQGAAAAPADNLDVGNLSTKVVGAIATENPDVATAAQGAGLNLPKPNLSPEPTPAAPVAPAPQAAAPAKPNPLTAGSRARQS